MSTPTPWANNITKQPHSFTPTTKSSAGWAPVDVRQPTQFVATTKQKAGWNPELASGQAYLYDDPDMTYDSPLWFYNSLVNGNTINQRLVTKWQNAL